MGRGSLKAPTASSNSKLCVSEMIMNVVGIVELLILSLVNVGLLVLSRTGRIGNVLLVLCVQEMSVRVFVRRELGENLKERIVYLSIFISSESKKGNFRT